MRVGFDRGEERSIGKLRLRYLRSFLENVHFADERYHPGNNVWLGSLRGTRKSSWSATRPGSRSAIFYFDDRPDPTLDHQQAIARRGAALGGELGQMPERPRGPPPISEA